MPDCGRTVNDAKRFVFGRLPGPNMAWAWLLVVYILTPRPLLSLYGCYLVYQYLPATPCYVAENATKVARVIFIGTP